MQQLFKPATALMKRLRFKYKFVLPGLVAGALLLWLGFNSVSQLNQRVQMIESERAAVALMATLVEWNKVLIENRRIVIMTAPADESVRQRLKQQAGVIEQQNAALVEEAAAAAESMQHQAESLGQAVAVFKVDGTPASEVQPEPALESTRLERRGPNRAKNVARMPKREVEHVVAARALERTGTHDQ